MSNTPIKRHNPPNTYQYGVISEQLAAEHLSQLGYTLLHQRYKCRYGELDLICCNADTLLFVEVKARKNIAQPPIVTHRQIVRNCSAAAYFLGKYPTLTRYNLRFDYIIICGNKIAYHLENAWEYVEALMD